jgi:redox-sensitive bicupin YhaK (pirin superfamily)
MAIDFQLAGHARDLGGGFTVRRFLPSAKKQSVGPFIFFDHFGPVSVNPADNYDVRPHPHIGLATVTYLFEGTITHRDNLGSVQDIAPGAINWMTAGRGIAHSERRPHRLADTVYVNHGIQLWAALPVGHEEAEPSFTHTPAADIPALKVGDANVRVLIGSAFGLISPVNTFAPTLYLDVALPAGASLTLPALAQELAVYAVDAGLRMDGELVPPNTLAVLKDGAGALLESTGPAARLMVLGGDALPERRFIWWNFVSSSKERIAQAADDWEAGRFAPVPGETEFIPLPERRFD